MGDCGLQCLSAAVVCCNLDNVGEIEAGLQECRTESDDRA